MSEFLLISDAAKEVKVESHVLRYWEDELNLPIKRNELGHRYYTYEDVERFKQIKTMKEQGLQLKAIRMILKDGKLNVLPDPDSVPNNGIAGGFDSLENETEDVKMPITIISDEPRETEEYERNRPAVDVQTDAESSAEKSQRLQWLLKQLIKETLIENNKTICKDIRESVVKELDYQFRSQEEREDERERRLQERNEEYYKKMDEILRSKSVQKNSFLKRNEKQDKTPKMSDQSKEDKKIMKKLNEEKTEENKTIDIKDHKRKKQHRKFFL